MTIEYINISEQKEREYKVYSKKIEQIKKVISEKDTLFGLPIVYRTDHYVAIKDKYIKCYTWHDIFMRTGGINSEKRNSSDGCINELIDVFSVKE